MADWILVALVAVAAGAISFVLFPFPIWKRRRPTQPIPALWSRKVMKSLAHSDAYTYAIQGPPLYVSNWDGHPESLKLRPEDLANVPTMRPPDPDTLDGRERIAQIASMLGVPYADLFAWFAQVKARQRVD